MPGISKLPSSPAMKEALKRYIMRDRQKKKEEEAQHTALEQQLKEREIRKQEATLTLEKTKEQILELEKKLLKLKEEKHQYFAELKKVLNRENEQRKQQQQSQPSKQLKPDPSSRSLSPEQIPQPSCILPQSSSIRTSGGVVVGVKRTRSPTPPPAFAEGTIRVPTVRLAPQIPTTSAQYLGGSLVAGKPIPPMYQRPSAYPAAVPKVPSDVRSLGGLTTHHYGAQGLQSFGTTDVPKHHVGTGAPLGKSVVPPPLLLPVRQTVIDAYPASKKLHLDPQVLSGSTASNIHAQRVTQRLGGTQRFY